MRRSRRAHVRSAGPSDKIRQAVRRQRPLAPEARIREGGPHVQLPVWRHRTSPLPCFVRSVARSRQGNEAGPPRAQGRLAISGQKRDVGSGRACTGLPRRPLSAPVLAFTLMGGCALVSVLCAVATADRTLPLWQQLPLLLVAAALALWVLAFGVGHLRAAGTWKALRRQLDSSRSSPPLRQGRR